MPRPSKQVSEKAGSEAMSNSEVLSRDAEGNSAFLRCSTKLSIEHGAEVIRRAWEHAPPGPGVYRMISTDGEVLYVGKAKSVRKRIASYMRPEAQSTRGAKHPDCADDYADCIHGVRLDQNRDRSICVSRLAMTCAAKGPTCRKITIVITTYSRARGLVQADRNA
jgi:GIY-YIG catalytic domain